MNLRFKVTTCGDDESFEEALNRPPDAVNHPDPPCISQKEYALHSWQTHGGKYIMVWQLRQKR